MQHQTNHLTRNNSNLFCKDLVRPIPKGVQSTVGRTVVKKLSIHFKLNVFFFWSALVILALGLSGCGYLPGQTGGLNTAPMNTAGGGSGNSAVSDKKVLEAINAAKDLKLDVQALSSKVADMDRRIMILSEEVSRMSPAKLEELDNKLAIISEEFRLLEKRLNKKIGKGKKASLKGTFTPNPKVGKKSPNFAETESQLYKQATDLFYAKKYSKALQLFQSVTEQYPKGTFADNAVFWSGECHFSMGNFAKAVQTYRRTFDYLNTEKADDAQFKIGVSYLRMGEKKQAVIELEKLLSLYPDSEYAIRAQKELKKH